MDIRSIAILFLIGISVCMCGCLDVESNCQHEINQAVAERDDEWQQILAERDADARKQAKQVLDARDAEWQQILADNNAEWGVVGKQAIEARDAQWQQVIADRDVQWQNSIRRSTDQQTLDFIIQLLPLLI